MSNDEYTIFDDEPTNPLSMTEEEYFKSKEKNMQKRIEQSKKLHERIKSFKKQEV